MSNQTVRLIPPQRVADGEQVAPLVYSVRDTGRLLGGMSMRTVERLIARGELDSIGHYKLRRVTYSSIVAYIERNRNEAP
jgi:Helix-turn-helix domain